MKKDFTDVERITNTLMLNSYSINDIGLFHGRIGIVIYFYILARKTKNRSHLLFADELLDDVVESLHPHLPIDFATGITGVGWGMEYLIQNGYINADSDDVLEEIDERVENEIRRKHLTIQIIISIIQYYISRISYRMDSHAKVVAKCKKGIRLLLPELKTKKIKDEDRDDLTCVLHNLQKINLYTDQIEIIINQFELKSTKEYLLPLIEKRSIKYIESTYYLDSGMNDKERFGLKHGLAGLVLNTSNYYPHPLCSF